MHIFDGFNSLQLDHDLFIDNDVKPVGADRKVLVSNMHRQLPTLFQALAIKLGAKRLFVKSL